jgi:hypothetical protein
MVSSARGRRRPAAVAVPAAFAVPAAIALFAAGCARPPAPGAWIEPPGRDPVAAVRARSLAADRVQASLELTWEDPVTGAVEGCSAFLVFDRGRGLRVLARTVAFVTVFELVADGEQAWLDVPREELTVHGPRDDPDWNRLPASPDAFLVALLADPWAGAPAPGPFRRAPADASALSGEGWTLRLDPATGLPASYERQGLRIEWGEWAMRRGVPWPHEAAIRTEAGVLRARLGRLLLDRPGSPGQFDFRPGEGRELLTPAEAQERWKAALEAL